MCYIQKAYLSPNVPRDLIAFMAVAWLVGSSTRLIHYFPKVSKGGLFLSAGLAGTASYLYDCRFDHRDDSYLRVLLGKAEVIALAAVATRLAAKSLKGRLGIPFEACVKFAAVEFIVAAILAKATQETPLQREHRHYLMAPRSWMRLEKERRTELAKAFMEAGLPALCLEHAEIDTTNFPHPETEAEWEALTPSELSWACQIIEFDPLSSEKKFALYLLCLRKGIEPRRFALNEEDVTDYFRGKPEEIELLYQDFSNHPEFFYLCDEADQKALSEELFAGRTPILKVVNVSLSTEQAATMPFDLLMGWSALIDNEKRWGEVSPETRTAFIKRYEPYLDEEEYPSEFYSGIDSSWLAELTVEELENITTDQLEVYSYVVEANKSVIKSQLSTAKFTKLNASFKKFGHPYVE